VLSRYRSILRQPGALRVVVPALVARLPVGINAIAVVLLVHRLTGSFVDAGIVDAGLAVGAVLISPGQGRLVDRFGQPRVLIPSALISSAALVGLDIAVHRHVGVAALTVLAAIGGGALPPMSASMRALWVVLIPEPDRLDIAFALEAVLTEVYFIGGPLITALIVAVASPSAAVLTAAGLTIAGTIAFATSHTSRVWRGVATKHTLAGPLAGPGVRTLVLSTVPTGMAFGTLEVAMPALATRHGDPAAAGLLLAAFCAGSLIGGVIYGARSWRLPLARRYLILYVGFAVGLAPLILAGAIPVMVVLIAVAGLMLAPMTACEFALIEDVAPPGTTTEAFSWIFTANMVGWAVGAALAGALVASSGLRTALLIPPCGVAAGFLLVLAWRRTLAPLPSALARRGAVSAAVAAAVPGGLAGPAAGAAGPAASAAGPAAGAAGPARRARAVSSRVSIPSFLAAGLVVAAALLGYRPRGGRFDPNRRPRRR
jgi:MFS family permease